MCSRKNRTAAAFLMSSHSGGPRCCKLFSILVLPYSLMLQFQGQGRHAVLMWSGNRCQAVLTSPCCAALSHAVALCGKPKGSTDY